MRKRAPQERVLPATVVECIKPALLTYICKYLLPPRYRTDRPETVSALVLHRWVMQKPEGAIAAETNEGVDKIQHLKLVLNGSKGVRNVQQTFMELGEIRRKYRLSTAEKQIVKWLVLNIEPEKTKSVVENYLKQNDKEAKRASKTIDAFHDLIMGMANKMAYAYELGFGAVDEETAEDEEKKGKIKGSHEPDGENDPEEQSQRRKSREEIKAALREWLRAGKCVHCGQQHKVTVCPTIPTERKNWSWTRIFKARNQATKGENQAAKGENRNGNNGAHPGGENE